MTSWRDTILEAFVPDVSKLTLVADPDGLLTEEGLALALRDRGFDLIEFDDPVAFRYAYESKYRDFWDRDEPTDLVVILRLQDAELESLPYDLLQAGRKLSFNLGELFPHMSYSVLETLDRSLLDGLFQAQSDFSPPRMGDNATMDFILRHVFGIAAELIVNDVDLLRTLLTLHYREKPIPPALADRVVQILTKHKNFAQWPLEWVVPDAEAFFDFLQERWPLFLSGHGDGTQVREALLEQPLAFTGPELLPFDHDDIKVYIDNLFLERKLTPIAANDADVGTDSWVRCGISTAGAGDDAIRASRLFELVEQELPPANANYADWISFAPKWAELSALVHRHSSSEHQARYRAVSDQINTTFAGWLSQHYAGLINVPPTQPAMLHHVPRHMARVVEATGDAKAALIVMDGLALDQWAAVKEILKAQDASLTMRESATFAWVPTLTSVSRQSVFAGKPPLYFPATIDTTNNEEKLWKQFWEAHGLSRKAVAYRRGLGSGDASEALDAVISPDRTRVAGFVVDTVDKIMHGMQLGSAGMHNQIKQWCEGGFLADLIGQLLDADYQVWLTADHGNIEGEGQGRPSEGSIAETRGERARIYPTPELRAQVAESFSFAHEWEPVGLPENFFPLEAGHRDAFVSVGDSIVGHGGISIEEVIVPFVKFERKENR